MNRRVSALVVLAAVGILAGLAALWLPPYAPTPAPDVEFQLLSGERIALRQMRGRMVLINFWATTCPPCVEELPDLVELYEDLHQDGLEVIGVAMPYDPPNYVLAFSARHPVPYAIALDLDGKITQAFDGVSFVPTSFVVDPDGLIIYRRTGRLDVGRVRRIIGKHAARPASRQ